MSVRPCVLPFHTSRVLLTTVPTIYIAGTILDGEGKEVCSTKGKAKVPEFCNDIDSDECEISSITVEGKGSGEVRLCSNCGSYVMNLPPARHI